MEEEEKEEEEEEEEDEVVRIARFDAPVGFLEDLCAAIEEVEVEAEAWENEEDDEDVSPSYLEVSFMEEYFFSTLRAIPEV